MNILNFISRMLIGMSVVFFLSWAPINCFNMAIDLIDIFEVISESLNVFKFPPFWML